MWANALRMTTAFNYGPAYRILYKVDCSPGRPQWKARARSALNFLTRRARESFWSPNVEGLRIRFFSVYEYWKCSQFLPNRNTSQLNLDKIFLSTSSNLYMGLGCYIARTDHKRLVWSLDSHPRIDRQSILYSLSALIHRSIWGYNFQAISHRFYWL